MGFETILFEVSDGVATITFNRPDAASAGFSLVTACDLAIAAQSAVFTMAYTRAGLSPDGSSTFYMPRKIGDRRTWNLC